VAATRESAAALSSRAALAPVAMIMMMRERGEDNLALRELAMSVDSRR